MTVHQPVRVTTETISERIHGVSCNICGPLGITEAPDGRDAAYQHLNQHGYTDIEEDTQ